MLHLAPTEREIVEALLRKHIGGTEVWAFGSRVHGRNLKPFSDLDLAVLDNQALDPERLTGLRIAFADSDLPFRIDLVEFDRLEAGFREIIAAEHHVLQRAG